MKTTDMAAMAAALGVEVAGWEKGLAGLMLRVGSCFARPDLLAPLGHPQHARPHLDLLLSY
ncbi:hypothetical protein GCM10027569_83200 [Flindersiella endophytica]